MPELMQRFSLTSFFLIFLFASCAPQPVPLTVPTSIPSPIVPTHAPEIRFALIGQPQDVNVWELFDRSGATYADYAVRAEYWPRLYHLAPPNHAFESFAASGMSSEVIQENQFYVATVNLRADLKWTDASPFTAEDVAFTLNTAIAFELGYDWSTYSSRAYLDHVEALDPATVKYYFKQKPNVGVWQYGILQSPIVQKAFWEANVETAAKLLPTTQLRADMDKANNYVATVQADVARLQAENPSGQTEQIKHMQNELIFAQNNSNKLLDEFTQQMQSAQKTLYEVDEKEEPTLGVWMPAGEVNGEWVNKANPDFPFIKPNFDRAVYHIFKDEDVALKAFQNNEVDFILSPNDLVSEVKDAKYYPTYSARFLVFNPLRTQLADPAFRAALNCMIDRDLLAKDTLQNHAVPLDSFLLLPEWHDSTVKDSCTGMDQSARIEYAVKLLKDAGYSWTQEPNAQTAGQNLLMSNGQAFPKVTLATPSKADDALRYTAAKYIAGQAQYLGLSFAVQEMNLNDVVYAVYSSQKYDMALMGWRLSEYPAYLCEMFGGQNQYLYNSTRFKSACEALQSESNLDGARQTFRQIEAALTSELPVIPLFTVMRADIYHGLSYPGEDILNGWGGLYGAPSYALPSP